MEKICEYILAKTDFPGGLYLKSAVYLRYGGKMQLHFQTKGVVTSAQKEAINDVLEQKLPSFVREFSFELTRIYFDESIVQKAVQSYLVKNEPAISAGMEYATIRLDKKEDIYILSVSVNTVLKDAVLRSGMAEKLSSFLTNEYQEPFRVSTKFIERAIEENTEVYQEAINLRKIRVTECKEVVGKPVYGEAIYICDVEEELPSVILCGTIVRMKRFDPDEPREGERKRSTCFRFRLKDFTGEISCSYYAAQSRIPLVSKLYSDENGGAQVICSGKIVLNSKGLLELRVHSISLCTLPENFRMMPMPEKPEPPVYTKVQPKDFHDFLQEGMFSAIDLSVPSMLQNKTVVVFDTETTGVEFDLHKIAEIGAVRLVNGVITSTFHTLVNPERRMPKEAQSVNHITDEMLEDQPIFYEILPDFYKFTKGAVLAGHNVGFDISFLQYESKRYHYYFNNERMDTLELARKYIKGVANYKQETLAKYFGIDAGEKHRALDDALTCARILIQICREIDKLEK